MIAVEWAVWHICPDCSRPGAPVKCVIVMHGDDALALLCPNCDAQEVDAIVARCAS